MWRLGPLVLLLLTACSQAAATGQPSPTVSPTPASTLAEAEPVATTTTTPTATTTLPPVTTTTEPPPREFFVFMPGNLVPGFVDLANSIDGVSSVTISRTGTLHIVETRTAAGVVVDQPPADFVIPVEARVVDAGGLAQFLRTDDAPSLGIEEVVLGATSAEIRRLAIGDRITFEDDLTLTVSAILPDDSVGSSEVIVAGPDRFAAANIRARSARIVFDGNESELEQAFVELLPEDSVFRVGEIGGTSPRRGGFVRSQVFIKQRFGEFAYKPGNGQRFTIDPAWVDANIVEVDLPLLGPTRCHRDFAAMLTDVMQGLIDAGLQDVIDRGAFAGCWNPRFIAGSTRLSRHAFGVAADINFGNAVDGGPGSPVHPELLRQMAVVGLTSGHVWTTPDPGHFEWFGPAG